MGFGDFLKGCARKISSGVAAATSAIKKKAKETVEKVKEVGKKVKDKVGGSMEDFKTKTSNMWGRFTGKKNFDEAKRLHEEITMKFANEKKSFDEKSEKTITEIENLVDSINAHKTRIHTVLFPQMVMNMSKLRDVKVPKEFTLEAYKSATVDLVAVRSKSDLFKIDFDKMSFSTRVKSVITFGAYSRKKANETLKAVQEEEERIQNEIEKMKAELKKIEGIRFALENTESYFSSMVQLYEKLLVRVDNSMNTLFFKSMRFTHKLVSENLSLKMLPVVSQKEIEALITSSKILKKMSETKVANMNVSTIKKYEINAKNTRNEMKTYVNAA